MRPALAARLLAALLVAPTFAQDDTPPPVPADGGGDEQQQEQTQQDEKVQEGSGEPQPAAPLDDSLAPLAPTHPAIVWPLTPEALVEHLRLIASAHPECARLETLGTSAAGRPILALRLGASGAGEVPVLFVGEHRGTASAAPEALLECAWQFVESFGTDEKVRTLLTTSALVLAPALDPDRRVAGDAPAVRFELNFPSGWQPESVRPGAGKVSLAKPEALAVARYLSELRSASVVLAFTERLPRGGAYAGAEQPEADREVHERLRAALEAVGGGAPVPWFELGSPGGSMLDFAYQARGLFALALPLPGEDTLVAGGAASYTPTLRAWLETCLALLPRVELAQEGLERLAADTWQLDVRLRNAGLVPTLSAKLRQRERGTDVGLGLAGAKLVATAKKPTPEAPYTDASFQAKSPLSAGTLAGGEGRWLRLILEAESGATVQVSSGSSWAGTDRLELVLP